jgi:hypothetical protein
MKVNLTRLLESPKRILRPQQAEGDKQTASLTVVTNSESTSADRAYSFELEKEKFSLET